MENYNIPKLNLSESFSKQDSAWAEAIRRYEKENRGRRFRDLPEKDQQLLFMKSLSQFGLTMNNKGYIVRASKVNQGTPMNESVKALAEHVKKQVPLCDSIFRYQSEAYFDTFKTAKKLREAGALPELDWESEEMLGTDIGESVVLKGGERVWLDVPYLNEDESVEEEKNPDGHHHTSNEPFIDPDGPQDDADKDEDKDEVDEAEEEDTSTIEVNKPIALAGDSIWDDGGKNPRSVNVTSISVIKDIDEDDYAQVNVEHDGPWTIYTDTGF